jgi:hypothetical protein
VGKKCYFCEKRKAKYPTIIYPTILMEKEVELCSFCYKKYKKIKERYLVKAYETMIELNQKVK